MKICLMMLALSVSGCGAGGTVCAAIDVAHTACDVLPIRYLDEHGREQLAHVPVAEVRAAALRAKKEAR